MFNDPNAGRFVRYHFQGSMEVTEQDGRRQIAGRVNHLSLFGCGIDEAGDFHAGASVQVTIVSDEGSRLEAMGRVVYAEGGRGLGVAFTSLKSADERVLGNWIAELANSQALT